MIRIRVTEGSNVRDEITICTFHSFLVEAQTQLVIYVPCMRNSNLEIRIAGSSCRPQKMMPFKGIPGNQRHSAEKERPVLRNISKTAPLIYIIIQNRQHESFFTLRSFFTKGVVRNHSLLES